MIAIRVFNDELTLWKGFGRKNLSVEVPKCTTIWNYTVYVLQYSVDRMFRVHAESKMRHRQPNTPAECDWENPLPIVPNMTAKWSRSARTIGQGDFNTTQP